MNVAPGGLTGALGALSLNGGQRAGAVQRPTVQKPAASTSFMAPKPAGGDFNAGLFQARAVGSPVKAQSALPPPNPNLPRGSLIDLKI